MLYIVIGFIYLIAAIATIYAIRRVQLRDAANPSVARHPLLANPILWTYVLGFGFILLYIAVEVVLK